MDLVSGGAGFVGSHLALWRLERKRPVKVFDIGTSEDIPLRQSSLEVT